MNQPIYIWERAIEARPDIEFSEFRLKNHLVIFAFGWVSGGKRGRKIPVKWTADGKCYLHYYSTRYPEGDLNLNLRAL